MKIVVENRRRIVGKHAGDIAEALENMMKLRGRDIRMMARTPEDTVDGYVTAYHDTGKIEVVFYDRSCDGVGCTEHLTASGKCTHKSILRKCELDEVEKGAVAAVLRGM